MKLQDFLFVISTVIAATAAAQLPTDPGFQASPYFQHPAMLQQQYSQFQERTCYGPCGRVSKSVGVESLTAGEIVEVQYVTPTSGRVIVSLRADNGDIIINAAARICYRSMPDHFFSE